MMLTRSAAKALLTNRVTIYNNHKVPEDVLLEIFDAYRQLHELQPNYETLWNSRDGWFKLAHVCLHWRRVLLLSTSRLHLHLLFTPCRPSRGPLSRCLPHGAHLPIWVDYTTASWTTAKEKDLALAALEQRSRVRGIALGSCLPDSLLSALSRPFPQLESLDICSTHYPWRKPILPAMSLPSLRRLTLRGVVPSSISPLVSSAKGLVELALTLSIEFEYRALPEHSLLANLQCLPCLRRLELKVNYCLQGVPISPPQSPRASAGDIVTLSKLTDIIFIGPCSYLQMLVVGLAAPSLQRLDVEIYRTSPTCSIPQLCKFIRDTENQFVVVSLYLFQEKLKFSADTSLTADHDAQPFSIIFPKPFVPLEEIGNMLSGPLSTVEELAIECHLCHGLGGLFTQHHIQWGGFFNHIPRLKVVRVPSEVAQDIAHSFNFKQGGLFDIFPSLEQVKVDHTHLQTGLYRDIEFKTIREAFEPLIAARQQAGRPIILSQV